MKSTILLPVLVLIGILSTSSRVITVQERYMEQYKYMAISEMNRSGIPASIKLAQGILESQSGRSELAVNANNHFGIKCKSNWSGETYQYKDDDLDENGELIHSCFRMYGSGEQSYIDHTDFILNRSRYKSLFSLPKNDYKAWAMGLKKCGYATDPNYGIRLIETIEKYNLNLLDAPVIEKPVPVLPVIENTIKTQVNTTNKQVVKGSLNSSKYSKNKSYNVKSKKRFRTFTAPRLSESK